MTFDHLEAGNSFSNKSLFKKKNPNDNILLPKIGGPESDTCVVVCLDLRWKSLKRCLLSTSPDHVSQRYRKYEVRVRITRLFFRLKL